MNPYELRSRFRQLRVWERGGKRAPHKPLLVLWTIGRCLRNQDRLAPFGEVEEPLKRLLRRFGSRSKRPDYPFWHLQSEDRLWEVQSNAPISETSKGDAHVESLRSEDACAGFPMELYSALQRDEALALEIAWSLIDAHFPPSLHLDLLDAVGISPKVECVWRRTRDSEFSREVLEAYHNSCAVCGFAVRMNGSRLALDAAHIKWHCASGPDQVNNGLALCAIHHRLFDAGAFTVSLEQEIKVAPFVDGTGFDDALERYRNMALSSPSHETDSPAPEFLTWHHREVFGADIAEEHYL